PHISEILDEPLQIGGADHGVARQSVHIVRSTKSGIHPGGGVRHYLHGADSAVAGHAGGLPAAFLPGDRLHPLHRHGDRLLRPEPVIGRGLERLTTLRTGRLLPLVPRTLPVARHRRGGRWGRWRTGWGDRGPGRGRAGVAVTAGAGRVVGATSGASPSPCANTC